jgi:hypothetical protein
MSDELTRSELSNEDGLVRTSACQQFGSNWTESDFVYGSSVSTETLDSFLDKRGCVPNINKAVSGPS